MFDSRQKSIPSWQLEGHAERTKSKNSSDSAETTPEANVANLSHEDPDSSDPDSASLSRESLIESATRWLQHDSIRDASPTNKTAFLKSKGLAQSDIDQLLQRSLSMTDLTTTDSKTARPDPISSGPISSSTGDTSTSPSSTRSPTPPPAPPIITYPEFLAHAHRPPPLVTASRVLNAAYATAFTSAVLWGTNRYLLTPMLESLSAARHSLFETTISNLTEMNEKLEKVVSVIPPIVDRPGDPIRDGNINGIDDDADSEASDPAEMFHRDVGVQTSPSLSTGDHEAGVEARRSATPAEVHTENLSEIKKHLAELAETSGESLNAEEETRASLGNLQAYLEELAYGGRKGPMTWEGGYGPLGEPMGSSRGSGPGVDEIARFKAEIRSVKGALLSARNFPTGGLGRGRGVTANSS